MKIVIAKCMLTFCLTGLLIGCHPGTRKFSDNNIQFDSLVVNKTYHILEVDTNPTCLLQINFVYPVNYENKDLLKSVQQQFIAGFFGPEFADLAPNEATEKYVADFLKTLKDYEKDFLVDIENHDMEMEETWYSIEETISDQIVYNRNDLISFVAYKTGYYGGAHGSHTLTNRVINLKTGLQITEDEIFIKDYQEDLAKIIVDAIALSNNVEIAELENLGFFNVAEIYPNKNFYVDETGITYTYNEYEIAAYVIGPVTVHIPYEKILHLMQKTSPIAAIAFQ